LGYKYYLEESNGTEILHSLVFEEEIVPAGQVEDHIIKH
jgi:hypothetical protein